ncbi:hypothetical protein AAC387_Pa02g0790 [Persea americana]
MNRGVLESSPVQQMMGGNLNWWNINNMCPPPQQPFPLLPSSSAFFPQHPPPTSSPPHGTLHENQDLPESWSQMLLSGLGGEEYRCSFNNLHAKKMNNWEEPMLFSSSNCNMIDVKQESSQSGYAYGHGNEEYQAVRTAWGQILPASSQRSCVTSFSSNMLDFSSSSVEGRRHLQTDHSSESNSAANSSAFKKAKIQSSAQSTFKVRKEKLGDRITALHQIVSPFGKTDTASVLLEAIGYIRFLQDQIEALSSPYLGSGSGNTRQPVQGERNCIFPEDPGQLLDDACMKKGENSGKDAQDEPKKDLRSRGLCLVPISCTMHVGSNNGADYWAPSLGRAFR